MRSKIAIVVSHPIQHFCPQYASFAKNDAIALRVFFSSALGYKKYMDPNFKSEISWGNLRLDEFEHEFLNGDRVIPSDRNLDAPALDERLEVFSPDLIIIYGYFQKVQRRAHRWALARKIPLAYISDSELRHARNKVKEWLKYFFIRKYFSGIRYFLSVGDANEDFYRFYGIKDNQFVRMHFPIDVIQYKESYQKRSELRESVRSQFDINDQEIVLLVVGKLTSWKNQDHIIDALELLEKEGLSMHLFILGSGEMSDAWKGKSKKLARSKVHFPGFIKIEDLPSYYAAGDIYVHPASLEPHSIAISEAIYMGCPVIVSDRCGSYGANDDVQENKNGFVFEFGNIAKLAEKIRELANHPIKRSTFAQHSHRIAEVFQDNAHHKVLTVLIESIQINK